MKRTALLFDLDGTLVDSVPDLQAAANRMLEELGAAPLDAETIRGMVGDGAGALVRRALESAGVAADFDRAHARFLALYEAEPTARTRPYPGVAETLAALRAAGCRLAVCTNKPQRATEAVLAGTGLASFIAAALGGDAVAHRKPDPRHLLAALDALGAAPETAAMIGDNENDHDAAKAAGLPVILMRYGYLRVPAASLSPDAWADRFDALPGLLARL